MSLVGSGFLFLSDLLEALKAVKQCPGNMETAFIGTSFEVLVHIPVPSQIPIPFSMNWIQKLGK